MLDKTVSEKLEYEYHVCACTFDMSDWFKEQFHSSKTSLPATSKERTPINVTSTSFSFLSALNPSGQTLCISRLIIQKTSLNEAQFVRLLEKGWGPGSSLDSN